MKRRLFVFILGLWGQHALSQYTVNGSATQNDCHCYTLTPDAGNKSGSVWNDNKIDLTQSFDFNFNVFLGANDAGADGIAFVLQPISTSVGGTGAGLGYSGIYPAVGVTIDTYQNTDPSNNDPVYDHIAIQLNGNLNHLDPTVNIAGPVTAIAGNDNIEDNNWHTLRITWEAGLKKMSAYIDGQLRVSAVNDLVTNVFSSNPLVYWGFTGSTGGAWNLQQFCTALSPKWIFAAGQNRCVNQPVTFYDSTISFTTLAKLYWDFGDGSPIDSVNKNPVHTYTVAGDYTVLQTAVGQDGCIVTNTQTLRIGSKPVASFNHTDSCLSFPVHYLNTSAVQVGTINQFYWDLDNGTFPMVANPAVTYTTGGIKHIKFVVQSQEGCISDTAFQSVYIYSRPVADFTVTDSLCQNAVFTFTDKSTSPDGAMTGWSWNFGDGSPAVFVQNPTHLFLTPGTHQVLLFTTTTDASCGGTIQKNVFVAGKPFAAIKYSPTCQFVNAPLLDSSYTTDGIPVTGWWWDLGNGQFSNQQNPPVTYNTPGPVTIRHVAVNAKGCISDTLTQTIQVVGKPIARFSTDTLLCNNASVQFRDSSVIANGVVGQWSWIYNGSPFSTQQNPRKVFAPGNQVVGLVVGSVEGCKSDTLFKTISIKTKPDISMTFHDTCRSTPAYFEAFDNNAFGISAWKWNFGDGSFASGSTVQHTYTSNGSYLVQLYGISANGCSSDTLKRNILIYGTQAFAGNDTIAAAGQPVQLHATGGISYLWTPSAGYLDNGTIANPVAILSATQTFTVKAFTPQGCESTDDVTINIYKGPDIYLPSAFTPNNDGLNDVFRGIPVGIKEFSYLKIYNRWGQEMFSTADYRKGWDGTWKGQQQEQGTYVVIAGGTDFHGNIITKRATVILIR